MGKQFKLRFFLVLILMLLSKINNVFSIEENGINWQSNFLNTYKEVVNKQDSTLYNTLIISHDEFDSLLAYFNNTNPNCITDNERNLKIQSLTKQFYQLSKIKNEVEQIIILNKYETNGCGNVKGIKINLKIICTDNLNYFRTLTFIDIKNNYRLLFDINSNNE